VRPERARSTSLVDELQRSHRFILGVLGSVLLLSLVTSGYLLLVTQPRLAAYVELARQSRDAHEGMLDQETGLRGWLATGDHRFLKPYSAGRSHTESAVQALLQDVRNSPAVTDDAVAMVVAREKWQTWATDAARMSISPADRTNGTLTRFLVEGKGLFDAYRVAEKRSIDQIKLLRSQAISRQTTALLGGLVAYLGLVAATGALTVRRRRRLTHTILRPIDDLHDTLTARRSGDLSARVEPTAVPELDEIGQALGGLAADLQLAGEEAASRERRLAVQARRFETVVTVGREIAGSLSVRYVSGTVTTAAAELLHSPAVLWLRGEDQALHVVHRSDDEHGMPPPAHLVPTPLVLQAATSALPVSGVGARAYPLVLAGLVTAVLEGGTTDVDPDTEQVLIALLSTAAAALESAHLHSTAREQADLDGLTRLPNRRRFEVDVDLEWERCRRYGRPLSLAMLDLDHFKLLNDRHGHLLGDQVLREVARVLVAVLRTTDTAYRYGGEEFVVLLRETGLEDATATAERLRTAVAEVVIAEHPLVTVSTSAGVAARQSRMAHHTELVAEADRALYEAKRLGRNRVRPFGLVTEPSAGR
jgi:diguanylate cyclase (GGDEF)-like protein